METPSLLDRRSASGSAPATRLPPMVVPLTVRLGQRFGRLLVIREADPYIWRGRFSRRRWVCECVCGAEAVVRDDSLKRSHTVSCGCLRDEKTRERATVHGAKTARSRWPEYEVWQSLLHRRNGAPVCKRWRSEGGSGFQAFLSDVGRRPASDFRLVRRNDARGYSPANCLWSREVRRPGVPRRLVVVAGKLTTLRAAAESAGVNYATFCKRLQRGWGVDAAMAGSKV